MADRDVIAPAAEADSRGREKLSPLTGGDLSTLVQVSGADGTTPTVPTTTAGSGSHVGLDVNLVGGTALAPVASFSTPAAVTAGGSAAAIGSGACIKGVLIQADMTNVTNARIGDANITTSRGFQLAPGDSVFWECTNISAVYSIAESGSPKLNVVLF